MNYFEELCKLNAEVQQMRHNAETILKREMVKFVDFYEKWLGVPILDPNHYSCYPPHQVIPYIETGTLNDTGSFVPMKLRDISINEKGTLCAAIKTTIPSRYDNAVTSIVHWRSQPDIHAQSVIIELEMMLENVSGTRGGIKINNGDTYTFDASENNKPNYSNTARNIKDHIRYVLEKNKPYVLCDCEMVYK